MKTIILFGGSFDPIHYGHLNMAKKALKQRSAFELWFIPTLISPFKDSSSDFKNRVTMIEMMIKKESSMKVCTIENELPSPSYSINTVEALIKKYPDYQFEWLIGDDQIESLHKWYEFEKLNSLVQFIVYDRHQEDHDYPVVLGDIMDVSSTNIRKGLQTATHPRILQYMMEEGLYLNTILKERLSEYRYEHTLRVTELALELAEAHPVSKKDMYLVAMMHDYSKEQYDDIYYDKKDVHQAIYHAYAAAAVLSKHYYVRNRKVLRAIRNHVEGKSHDLVAQLIYVADKCERGRHFETEHFIEMAKVDLHATFKLLKIEAEKYRKEA